jgi:MFS family permease
MAESQQQAGAAAEWRGYWFLPFVAGLGYSVTQLYAYALGPIIEPIQQEFGWTRAQVMSGVAIANVPGIILLPLVGMLVDRWGPRRTGLIGICLVPAAVALVATATGSVWQWWAIWLLIAFCGPWAQGSIWTSATVSRFEKGRGLALAVTLSGGAMAATVMPPLSTFYVETFGWRQGFLFMVGSWFLMLFVPVMLFFRGAQDGDASKRATRAERAAAADKLSGLTMPEAVRRPALYKLIVASFGFAFIVIGTVLHLVPMLKGYGAGAMQAAGTASLVGIFSIVGRLITGALLDRYRSNIIGCVVYLLPIPGYLLLMSSGSDPTSQLVAAAMFGLTLGAEVDVIAYLITVHFGLKRFASVMSLMFAFIALGSALGPYTAGHVFDLAGDYEPFMLGAIALSVLSSLLLLSMRKPAFAGHGH